MKKLGKILCAALALLAGPALGGAPALPPLPPAIFVGSAVIGTGCNPGDFFYNNAGAVGCSASSATIALPQAITGGVSGGIPYFSAANTMAASAVLAANALVIGGGAGVAPSTTTTGTGVLTGIASAVNTNGGLLTASTAAITANAIVTGAGSGTALTGTTPGTGVLTALGVNVGSAGAFVTNGGALGTPSSGTATNLTGLPISTGVSGLGANVATFLATPSSANFASAVTDETGTGSVVFANTPTLVTPVLGAATGTSVTLTGAAPQVVLGANATTLGSIKLFGNTSGDLTISPAATAGTASAVTFPGRSGTVAYTSGALTNGNCAKFDASGNIVDNGAACGGGSSTLTANSTATSGYTAGQLLYSDGSVLQALGLGTSTTVYHGNASGVGTFGAVNLATDVTGSLLVSTNAQTGTTYTIQASDAGKLVTTSNGSAVAVTLPQGTGSFGAGWTTTVLNRGAGTATITPTTSTINGAASIALTTGMSATIVSDGTNYNANIAVPSASGSPGGSDTQVQFNNAGSFGGSANLTWSSPALTIGAQQTTQGSLVLANTAAGAYATTIKSSNSASAAWTLTLPTTAGTADYVLKTDGSGNTSWVAQSGGGGSPGGSDTQIQYNSSGSFAGSSSFTWDDTNRLLTQYGKAGTNATLVQYIGTTSTYKLQDRGGLAFLNNNYSATEPSAGFAWAGGFIAPIDGSIGFNSDFTASGGTTAFTNPSGTAGVMQQGRADAASPVAQVTQVQRVVAGTSNTAGQKWTFKDSAGTGTGVSGGYEFQTADAGSSGTSQNTEASAFTIGVIGSGVIQIKKTYTVSGLPTCNAGASGSIAVVTDATAPTYNGALTGGGAVKVPVFCDGSAWTSH